MPEPHHIEIFSAACPACHGLIELVRRLAAPGSRIEVLDMHDAEVAARARELGIRSVPSLVIDGTVPRCYVGQGADAASLRRLLSLP